MKSNSPAGSSTYATSRHAQLGISRNTLLDTARANIDNFPARVLGRDGIVHAGVRMPNGGRDFVDWCSNDPACSERDILTLSMSFARDTEVYTAAMEGWPNIFPGLAQEATAEAQAVSGVLDVQLDFKPDSSAVCDDELTRDCSFDLLIPINGDIQWSGKTAACVRLVPDEENNAFRTEIVQSSVTQGGDSPSVITCNTQHLGRHMIVSYTPSPSPHLPPPPQPSPPPFPPFPPGEAPPPFPSSPHDPPFPPPRNPPLPPSPPLLPTQPTPAICVGDGTQAHHALLFDLEYDDNDNEEFRTRLRRQFASNVFQQFTSFFSHNGLEQCPDFVQVDLEPGHEDDLVADFSIELGARSTSEDARELEDMLASLSPQETGDLFDDEDLQDAVIGTAPQKPQPSACQGDNTQAVNFILFNQSQEASASLIQRVRRQYAANVYNRFRDHFAHDGLDQCPRFVQVDFLRGSEVARVTADVGSGGTAEDAEELEESLGNLSQEEARTLFDDQDLQNEVVAITDTNPLEGRDDDDGGSRAEILGPAIAIPVFFFLVVCIMIAVFLIKRGMFSTTRSTHGATRSARAEEV